MSPLAQGYYLQEVRVLLWESIYVPGHAHPPPPLRRVRLHLIILPIYILYCYSSPLSPWRLRRWMQPSEHLCQVQIRLANQTYVTSDVIHFPIALI